MTPEKHINKLKYKDIGETLRRKAKALMKIIETGDCSKTEIDSLFKCLMNEHPEIKTITYTIKYKTVYQIEE